MPFPLSFTITAAVTALAVLPLLLGLVPLIHSGSWVTSSLEVRCTSLPSWLRLVKVSGVGPETVVKFTCGVTLSRKV